MASVSRSGSNDERVEGASTLEPAARSEAEMTEEARKKAARSAAAKKAAKTRAANRAAKAAAAATAEAAEQDAAGATPSKRTAASTSASATSAAKRDSAAKDAASRTSKRSSASSAERTDTMAKTKERRQLAAAIVADSKTVEQKPPPRSKAAADASGPITRSRPERDVPPIKTEETDSVKTEATTEKTSAENETDTPKAVEAPTVPAAEAAEETGVAAIVARPAPSPAKPPRAQKKKARKKTLRPARPAPPEDAPVVLEVSGLVKRFGETTAVDGVSLSVREGSFFGIVGPNGAGKTTTLSMITGLLRPDLGSVSVRGVDVWTNPQQAKRMTGVLPDRLRLFDRLTGAQLLFYSGALRGLDSEVVRSRSADLAAAFGLEDALDRLVADYSAGMTKKVALACAMIHSPRLLVLDEPFESVDPVSAANVTEILERYVANGGAVVLSSHSMDLIERICDSVAVIVSGHVLAEGALDAVRGGQSLEERFVELAGGRKAAEGLEWLHSFSG